MSRKGVSQIICVLTLPQTISVRVRSCMHVFCQYSRQTKKQIRHEIHSRRLFEETTYQQRYRIERIERAGPAIKHALTRHCRQNTNQVRKCHGMYTINIVDMKCVRERSWTYTVRMHSRFPISTRTCHSPCILRLET